MNNEEIKEILDEMINLNEYRDYKIYGKRANEIGQLLLDYITNLQEQLHQASLDIQELTERDIWCPSNCDKLTNLQEENNKLKKLCDKYEEEHNTTFNYWKEQLETNKKPNLLQGEDNE